MIELGKKRRKTKHHNGLVMWVIYKTFFLEFYVLPMKPTLSMTSHSGKVVIGIFINLYFILEVDCPITDVNCYPLPEQIWMALML